MTANFVTERMRDDPDGLFKKDKNFFDKKIKGSLDLLS